MKKLIIAALAASTLATPVVAAPYQHQNNDHRRTEQRSDYRNDRHDQRQMQNRRWSKGERFDYRQARNYRVISNARQYHLRDAPRGYRWVRSGNDAVMVGIASGIVASVLANVVH